MLTMIDTRVPTCRVPGCSGALDKGFRDTGDYQGTYFFCTNCHMEYFIKDQGQSENELLCEYHEPEGKTMYFCDVESNTECTKESCHINGGQCFHTTHKKYAKFKWEEWRKDEKSL